MHQQVEGTKSKKQIQWGEFTKEVAEKLNKYPLIKRNSKTLKICRSLFNKGYTVADAVSFIILNS